MAEGNPKPVEGALTVEQVHKAVKETQQPWSSVSPSYYAVTNVPALTAKLNEVLEAALSAAPAPSDTRRPHLSPRRNAAVAQIYKLIRTVTIIGTKVQLDLFEKQAPEGYHKGTGGVDLHIASVGVRQLLTGINVPEPAQVPAAPGTSEKGT